MGTEDIPLEVLKTEILEVKCLLQDHLVCR